MSELTSFVYSGAPFSDAGFQFPVAPMMQTTTNFSVRTQRPTPLLRQTERPYSGPVAGLQWQYIYTASDNLNVTANAPNVFIHTGSGEDAINVSQANGNNVLDGSQDQIFSLVEPATILSLSTTAVLPRIFGALSRASMPGTQRLFSE